MATKKNSDLSELTAIADGDNITIRDVSDITNQATGETKRGSWTTIKAFLKTYFDGLYLDSPTLVTPTLGTPASGDLQNCDLSVPPAIGGTTPAAGAFTTLKQTTGKAAGAIPISDADGALTLTASTGSGAPVRAGSPTFTTKITTPQVAFPATAVPSADANTLDDYEEGTWTPTFVSASCTFAYSTQSGWYRKIGDIIHAQFFLRAYAADTITNAITMGSLPFTASNVTNSHGAASIGFSTFTEYPSLNGLLNSTAITIYQQGTTTSLTPTTSGMNGGAKYLQGIFTYHI